MISMSVDVVVHHLKVVFDKFDELFGHIHTVVLAPQHHMVLSCAVLQQEAHLCVACILTYELAQFGDDLLVDEVGKEGDGDA